MDAKPAALYPNVPTLKEATGSDWTMAPGAASSAPKGLPKDIGDKLVAALEKVYESKEYKDFMKQRGFGVHLGAAAEFATFMDEVGRRPRRGDEGGRHRQVSAMKRRRQRSWERCLRSWARSCSGTSRAFPPSPARTTARRCFPALIAAGLADLRRCCSWCAACAARPGGRWLALDDWARAPLTVVALPAACRPASCSTCSPATCSASIIAAALIMLALLLVFGVQPAAGAWRSRSSVAA